jgi:hypothetical protein
MSKLIVIHIVVFIICINRSFAQKIDSTKDPITEYVKGYGEPDPSETEDIATSIISKIVYDFNNDGMPDIALTCSHLWGAHIGPWSIYLGRKNGYYSYIDDIWFVASAVRVIPIKKGMSKIIAYWHWSAAQGELVETVVSSDSVKEIKRTMIYPDYYAKNEDERKYEELFHGYALPDSSLKIENYRKTKKIIWTK